MHSSNFCNLLKCTQSRLLIPLPSTAAKWVQATFGLRFSCLLCKIEVFRSAVDHRFSSINGHHSIAQNYYGMFREKGESTENLHATSNSHHMTPANKSLLKKATKVALCRRQTLFYMSIYTAMISSYLTSIEVTVTLWVVQHTVNLPALLHSINVSFIFMLIYHSRHGMHLLHFLSIYITQKQGQELAS